ncbi:MAG: hypothetical protein ABSG18_23610 [Steroidobacteraceae bacterium]
MLGEFIADGLLAFKAFLLLFGDGGIVERYTALQGDTFADLLNVELRNAVDDWQLHADPGHWGTYARTTLG